MSERPHGRPVAGIALEIFSHDGVGGGCRAVDLTTDKELFTTKTNKKQPEAVEFLAVVEAAKHIVMTGFEPCEIYTSSSSAAMWWNNGMPTQSCKKDIQLKKASIYLSVMGELLKDIKVSQMNAYDLSNKI